MANAVTQATIINNVNRIVKYITINSDGSEETALVIYDSSVLNAIDPLTCTIRKISYATSMGNTLGVNGNVKLLFDADTDILAWAIPVNGAGEIDFTSVGGLKNLAGTGRTGDITITTTGLIAGDAISLVLEVRPN